MLNFPQDVLRIGCILGQDEHHRLSRIYGMNDLISIEGTGYHVPRSDPARNPAALEQLDDDRRHGSILRGIADKYVGRDAMRASSLPFAVGFSHVDSPSTFAPCSQMHPVFIKILGCIRRRRGRTAPLGQGNSALESRNWPTAARRGPSWRR